MTDEKPKSEPGGWELMRAFERVEKRLDSFARDFVSTVVHNLLVERVKDIESDLAAERTAREKAVAELKQAEAEQRKSRAQTWAAIGVAGVAALFAIFGSFVRQGLGLP